MNIDFKHVCVTFAYYGNGFYFFVRRNVLDLTGWPSNTSLCLQLGDTTGHFVQEKASVKDASRDKRPTNSTVPRSCMINTL